MVLREFKFTRFKGEKNEWSIEGKPDGSGIAQPLTLENINLIVGLNASGKSRTVDAIRRIADLISGEVRLSNLEGMRFSTVDYALRFEDEKKTVDYILEIKQGKIIQEILGIDGHEKLNRKKGLLYYEVEKRFLEFQIDDNILAVSKRDSIQHPYFEGIYLWCKNLNHFKFGGQMGQKTLIKDSKEEFKVNLKDGNNVAEIFVIAKNKFANFEKIVLKDMKEISYNIKKVDVFETKIYSQSLFSIKVKEVDVESFIDQIDISQGMFRALSLIIQLNYFLLSKESSCILIDDIGEGLDFERSKELIDLIIKKVEDSNIQIVLTTNDRFTMNKIPLKYWSVIQREPKKSIFYNYRNSKEIFDEFEYSGFNNFDFLSYQFYIKGFETVTL